MILFAECVIQTKRVICSLNNIQIKTARLTNSN